MQEPQKAGADQSSASPKQFYQSYRLPYIKPHLQQLSEDKQEEILTYNRSNNASVDNNDPKDQAQSMLQADKSK